MEKITSRTNPRLAHIRRLASSASYRRECGEFLCDSPKLLHEALLWGAEILQVVYTAGTQLPKLEADVALIEVPEDIMAFISPMKTPQGVLFTCCLPRAELPEELEGAHYMVLDGVQDPGNVGTIWRTADAFGCNGLVLLSGCADPYSPKTVRASMGAVFRCKVWTCTAQQLSATLQRSGLPLYGSALRDDTLDAREVDYSRAALAIGSEGRGLTEEVLSLCDKTIRIPMAPQCESLNAAIAATVLLWETFR